MPSGRRPAARYHPTPGGAGLRQLRLRAQLTLLDMEGLTGEKVTTAQLHRIEVGITRRPQPETVMLLLTALQATFRDQRQVLESFGYRLPLVLPTDEEIAEIRQLCRHELREATYPIYLIDFGQRLLDWNRYMPRLIGRHPDDPDLVHFMGVTIFDLAFNPALGASTFIANAAEYLPAMLQFIKAGIDPFHDEPWYRDLIAHARQYPGFDELWDRLPADILERYATRSIVPMVADVPGIGKLQFRLSSSEVVADPRFQIVHYTPYGAKTLHRVAQWAKEEGVE